MVADDHDPDTSYHDSFGGVRSPDRPVTPEFLWSQHSQLVNRVSGHDNDITMIKVQYGFLSEKFDGLGENIGAAADRSGRRFEAVGSEINRGFKSMDRKMTTWVLGLMGLVVKGGFDFLFW